ncbi:hypothetical protein ACO0LO_26980 [Undibacterium sp. TJN25]|uniref:hypothetical protein n=1 Tax=Undibacterium sp. TJN25 TaxID=3413056 RepID=UPI003BF1B3F9
MNEVSLIRLYLLRGMYLLVVVGLGIVVLPGVIHHDTPWTPSGGVVQCMLAAFWFLSLLGLRYPLQMLPVLLWELLWKTTWLIVVAAPLWSAGKLDDPSFAMVSDILWVVIVPFVIPWHYVFSRYVQQRGDRWIKSASGATAT